MSEQNAHNADLSSLKIDRDNKRGHRSGGRKWLYILWVIVPVIIYFIYQYILVEITPAIKVKTGVAYFLDDSAASAELVATGYVVAQIKAAVSSKATGRLRSLRVEEGDKVTEGDIIAEIENDDIIANLDIYRAYLKQYQADSLAAYLNYKRQKDLFESGFTTNEMVEQATAQYERALANVEADIAQVKAAQVSVENAIIRAPFSGTVLTKDADVGEMVAPMAASASSRGAVVTIADMTSLEVEADVSESNIQKVIVNQPCEIILDAYSDKKYEGFVKKIVPTADRSRATVMVKVAFINRDDRVLPEMSARVNFMRPDDEKSREAVKPALVVDKNAVVMRNNRKAVFQFDNGYARLLNIEPGREFGSVTEILSGLVSGTAVILSPPGGLNDGDKVELSN